MSSITLSLSSEELYTVTQELHARAIRYTDKANHYASLLENDPNNGFISELVNHYRTNSASVNRVLDTLNDAMFSSTLRFDLA